MAYLELFERAADHVRRQRVKVTFERGKPLSAAAIERVIARAVIPIPPSMAGFYAEVGDGLVFAWEAKGKRAPHANHEVPPLAELTPKSLDDIRWRTEWNDDYDFRFTKDPALAKRTAMRMRRWLPFHHEGNGDRFCLDTAADPAPVVFDRHDWYDGGTGDNGPVMGRSLLDFYTGWSAVCFQSPESLYWPRVLRPSIGGVDWNSPEFRDPFRIPAADH
jgi:hypothetical protein